MDIIKYLMTTLLYVLLINMVFEVFMYWPRKSHKKTSIDSENKMAPWSWKDTIWLIIMLLSTISCVVFIILLSTNNNTKIGLWLKGIFIVSFYIKHFSRVIPSVKTIKQIVTGNTIGTMNAKENNAVFWIALTTVMLYGFQIPEKIKSYAFSCDSSILGDCIIAFMIIMFISFSIFFICALSVGPLQFILLVAKRAIMRISAQTIKQYESKIEQHLFGTMSTKTMTVSLVESIKKHKIFLKILLYPIIPIAFILDVTYRLISFFFNTIVSIIWYIYQIAKQVIFLFGKMGNWVLSLSDKTVVTISFRFAIILGLGLTVTVNRYSPIFRNQEESTAVLEFLSSTIIIPVILEWILSFKKRDNN